MELSLAKVWIWGIRRFNLSTLIVLIKVTRLWTAAILTSVSGSFNKVVKVWIKEISMISLPKASANYLNYMSIFEKERVFTAAKFLASASLIFQDLSSVAPIMMGNVWVLFSSLLRSLAICFKLLRQSTLTES